MRSRENKRFDANSNDDDYIQYKVNIIAHIYVLVITLRVL